MKYLLFIYCTITFAAVLLNATLHVLVWACMEQVLEMIDNPHYLDRMTILHAISLLAPVMGSEITCSKLLPVVVTSSKDRHFNLEV